MEPKETDAMPVCNGILNVSMDIDNFKEEIQTDKKSKKKFIKFN